MRKKSHSGTNRYILNLYVSGCTPRSHRVIEQVKHICEHHLGERFQLEIIDMYKHPDKVREDQIVASPTLLKKAPLPEVRIIGDMSNTHNLLIGLGLA